MCMEFFRRQSTPSDKLTGKTTSKKHVESHDGTKRRIAGLRCTCWFLCNWKLFPYEHTFVFEIRFYGNGSRPFLAWIKRVRHSIEEIGVHDSFTLNLHPSTSLQYVTHRLNFPKNTPHKHHVMSTRSVHAISQTLYWGNYCNCRLWCS